jgi:hypothetical protein
MSAARRSLQVVAFLCTLLVGVTSMAVIITQTTWFKEWLRGFIVRQAEDYVNGQLTIGRLEGNLFFGVRLADVDVKQSGQTVVGVDNVGLNYNFLTFLKGDVVLDDVRLIRPVLRLERTADGRLNLADLIKAQTPRKPKSQRTIEVSEIGISDGTLYVEPGAVGTSGITVPEKVEGLDASLGVTSNADALTVKIRQVSLRTAEPAIAINALSGVVRQTENGIALDDVSLRTDESSLRVNGTIDNLDAAAPVINLQMSSDKLVLAEIARVLPQLQGYVLQPSLDIRASGPADRLAVTLNVRDARAGKATGMLVVDAVDPGRRIAGTVSLEHLNVALLVPPDRPAQKGSKAATPAAGSTSTLTSDMTGTARFDLALPEGRLPLSGTYSVNAGHVVVAGYEARDVVARGRIDGPTIRVDARAAAYGGHATAAGTVKTGSELALDLKGKATDLDLRNLPTSLSVPAVASHIDTVYTLEGRGRAFSGTFALDESTLAGATLAAGTTGSFAMGSGAPQYTAKGRVTNLDLEQVGQQFQITALAVDRYRSTINASFDVTGSGGGEYPLTLDATGTVVDSTLFGASFPMLDVTANLADGDAHVKTAGQFANLNPATISGNEKATGMVQGNVDVDATLRGYADGVTADSIDVSGHVALGYSTLGALSIDMADVEGDYARREGMLRTLVVTGADVNVTAEGPIALTDNGSTNVKLHAETASLDEVGQIIGRALRGAVAVDATVTGNAQALDVKGTLKGSDIGEGENDALSLTSNFDVTIPELAPERAVVKASNLATFIQVSGQKITELTADVTYDQSKLDFQAKAQEGVRQLDATGTVIFHPDHQEIHLPSLALRAEQVQWQTPSGSEARVQYSADRVAVEDLLLVNGDQKIAVDGVIGSDREPLHVRAENIDVAQVDTLFLGDQRIGGRFSADATVSGPMKDPRVEGEFSLTQGSFRTYKFDALTGKVAYVQNGVDVDVRLQQSPTEWLTAKGTAPLTLFTPTPPEKAGEHVEPTPGDTVNLEVASSQINLAAIQGFTSYVTNVTGVLQANVKVTGSGQDPHLTGAVDIRGGSFTVPGFGTKYTGLDTRVDLNSEGLTVQEFKILDGRGFPLSVGGTLALHARSVGAVDVKMQSSKFEVINNKTMTLKLNTDVHVTGELRRPKVEGTIVIDTGTIDVAQLLQTYGADPYATSETAINTEERPAGAGDAAPPPLFDALEMNVALSVPSDLVLKGNNIEAANSPVSLGSMNVTVGGKVDILKPAGGRLRLNGDVNTVRGTYNFQGRRFEIQRDGRIGFSGAEELNPLLDLKARREISGIETFINVRGTMRRPELTFTSNPPLEEADVLSLIIFNQPINQLGEGEQQSLTQRAGALAGGYLTSGLSRSIGSALSLDEFEIQAQGENGAGPSVTVGQQVGRNLFFRLRQAFGADTTTEVVLEYQIRDYLRAQGSVAQGASQQRVQFRRIETAGLDLIFFFSY